MANSIAGSLISGYQAIASAGTAEALAADNGRRYTSITIVAEADNTGNIFVGGSDVQNDGSTNKGLPAGSSLTLTSSHGWLLSEIFLDAGTTGDGADFYGAY
tara:strand:+ start:375 stop:680 length:306 start_codon:yes stop_codon:yes gene_type:complete